MREDQSNRTTSANRASTRTAADSTDRIEIVVINSRQTSFDVNLTVTSEQEQVFRQTAHVGANGGKEVLSPDINEQGIYELTVTLSDEDKHTRRFSIGEEQLRNGFGIEIGEEIRLLVEE
ncbi:hypothetical protein ACFPYI_07505 [Halomarina salina]|uniref:Ig-like domain-containing protein n=1 Tax=Halomarina salina TaxID=1872699 RepID=A0ABD5RLF4_9EURY|nr:hypothetical protein [Halomarina salina]